MSSGSDRKRKRLLGSDDSSDSDGVNAPVVDREMRTLLQDWINKEGTILKTQYELSLRTNNALFFELYCNNHLKNAVADPAALELILGRQKNRVLGLDFEQWRGVELVDVLLTGFIDPPTEKQSSEEVEELSPPTKQRHKVNVVATAYEEATMKAWQQEFIGEAHEGLFRYIKTHFASSDTNIYARYLVILNSSGLGKTKATDEMAKTHFLIPLCLRAEGTNGYPPPDNDLRDSLLGYTEQEGAYLGYIAFLEALFEHAAEMLETEGFKNLSYTDTASEFRRRMTEGMTMASHNAFRVKFYKSVLKRSKKRVFSKETAVQNGQVFHGTPPKANSSSKEDSSTKVPVNSKSWKSAAKNASSTASANFISQDGEVTTRQVSTHQISQAAENVPKTPSTRTEPALVEPQTLPSELKPPGKTEEPTVPPDPHPHLHVINALNKLVEVLSRRKGAPNSKEQPLVLLGVDEAHAMTIKVADRTWSKFGEFRAVLRAMSPQSLFAIFLSTTGKFSWFTPASVYDTSNRIIKHKLRLIPPFSDLGLDVLTRNRPDKKLSLTGAWTLEQVTTNEFMSRLGRPLFGLHYQNGNDTVKDSLLFFAAQKLLNHHDMLPPNLTDAQSLACLSFRLPIEFVSSVYKNKITETEQVEGHLRICLKAHSNRGIMTTVSASEPLLSEASYFAVHRCNVDMASVFRSLSTGFCVSAGDRGEYLAMLLLTLARDATVGPPKPGESGIPTSESRIVNVCDFLTKHLLKLENVSPDHQKVLTRLATDFSTARTHFNHYIRLHEQKAIDRDCLLLQMGRGGAVMCAPNQPGVDIIHPFLVGGAQAGDRIMPSNLGAILIQVKNDPTYGANPRAELFDRMNPFEIGILDYDEGDKPIPLIRIVFALAAKTPGISVVPQKQTKAYNAAVYDIWIAGLSHELLRPIMGQAGQDMWEATLSASHAWRAIYLDDVEAPAAFNRKHTPNPTRQSLNPATASDDPFWTNWGQRPRERGTKTPTLAATPSAATPVATTSRSSKRKAATASSAATTSPSLKGKTTASSSAATATDPPASTSRPPKTRPKRK